MTRMTCTLAQSRLIAFALALFVVGCGDPPTTSPPISPCGQCLGPTLCNELTGLCEPIGRTDVEDTASDAPDADGAEEDRSDGRGDAGDTEEDVETDITEDTDLADEDGGDDPNEGDVDGADEADSDDSDAQDSDADSDAADEEVDGLDAADQEVDTGPTPICPRDYLEVDPFGDNRTGDDDPNNDEDSLASRLHVEWLAGTNSLRTSFNRTGYACGDLAFEADGDTQCVDAEDGDSDDPKDEFGPCDCIEVNELGACSLDDKDWLSFSLLEGDVAWVRVIFDNYPHLDWLVVSEMYAPPRDEISCGSNRECLAPGAETGPPCIRGRCSPELTGVWLDTDDNDQVETFEYALGSARVAEGAGTSIANYFLRVWSGGFGEDPLPELPYRVVVQVAPDSRACSHDEWDANWDVYKDPCDPDDDLCPLSSEDECTDDSCTLPNDAPDDRYNICAWDRQDVFRHLIDGGSGTETRRVTVTWDVTTDADIGTATLWRTDLTDPQCMGTVPRGDSLGVLEADFDNLVDGEYQLVVANNRVITYAVKIEEPSDSSADSPGSCE